MPIVLPYGISNGDVTDAVKAMANWNAIIGVVNGQLDDTYIKPAANIDAAKLLAASVKTPQIGVVPRALVYHDANQPVGSGSSLVVLFNHESWDTDTMHDTASLTSRLTIRTSGIYLMTANIELSATGGGTYRAAYLRVNGTQEIARDQQAPAAQNYLSVSAAWRLSVNDIVEVVVTHDAGVNVDVVASASVYPQFSAVWIGAP